MTLAQSSLTRQATFAQSTFSLTSPEAPRVARLERRGHADWKSASQVAEERLRSQRSAAERAEGS